MGDKFGYTISYDIQEAAKGTGPDRKAREKLEKRVQRKLEKPEGGAVIDGESDLDDDSLDVLDINSLGVDAEPRRARLPVSTA